MVVGQRTLMLHDYPPYVPANQRRCHSAPPYSLPDVGQSFCLSIQLDVRTPRWQVGFSLESYRNIRDVHKDKKITVARVLILDSKLVLKMFSPLVDVAAVVEGMRLARAVAPVPKVVDYGHSGNCAYIMYEYVHGHVFSRVLADFGDYATAMIEPQITTIIRDLAAIGLAHNDITPRNIVVDDDFRVIAIIDWDFVSLASNAREYGQRSREEDLQRRSRLVNGPSHLFNHAFLRHSAYAYHDVLSLNPVDGRELRRYRNPPLYRLGNAARQSFQASSTLPSTSVQAPLDTKPTPTYSIAVILHGSGMCSPHTYSWRLR